jgi:beta-lactamase regulating signal transducer with metallopeptidase domain
MSLSELLNATASSWAIFMGAVSIEITALLLVVSLLWLVVRRRGSARLGYFLFLLVPLKLLVPATVAVPAGLSFLSNWHDAEQVAIWALPDRGEAAPQALPMHEPIQGVDGTKLAAATEDPAALAGSEGPMELPDALQWPADSGLSPAPGVREAAETGLTRSAHGRQTLSRTALFFLGWLTVVGVLLVGFARAQWRTFQLIRRAKVVGRYDLPVDIDRLWCLAGVRRPMRMVESAAVAAPAVWGLLRPSLILPPGLARDLTPNQLTWVLLHELAHVRRCDLLVTLVQRLAQIAYFFHPAVWLANRLIDELREYACDDDALAACQLPRRDCGEGFLIVLERASAALVPTVPVLGLFTPATFYRKRLLRILDEERPIVRRLSIRTVALLLGLAAILLPRLQAKREEPALQLAPAKQAEKPKPNAPPTDPQDVVVFSGRALDPDGKPFAGAKLYVTRKGVMEMPLKLKDPTTKVFEYKMVEGKQAAKVVHPDLIAVLKRYGIDPDKPLNQSTFPENPKLDAEYRAVMQELYEDATNYFPRERAVSGPDGRYRFTLSKKFLTAPYHDDVDVIALAEGFGPGWTWAETDVFTDMTVRLARDIPIEGRIISMEGKPIAGVKVELGSIMVAPDGTINPWAEVIEASASGDYAKFDDLSSLMLKKPLLYSYFDILPRYVVTDKNGRFRIRGIGAERIAFRIKISGAGIAAEYFSVITRPGPGIKPERGRVHSEEFRTYGATFEHVVSTVRPVIGTVRDHATGQPLADVSVWARLQVPISSVTDKNGKYRLFGVPKGNALWIQASRSARDGVPYAETFKFVADEPGLEPMTVDFDLVPGVRLRGRVTDRVTGKPVPGARVYYTAFKDNPHAAYFADAAAKAPVNDPYLFGVPRMPNSGVACNQEGSFSMAALPGRGLIAVQVIDGPYARVTLPEIRKDRLFWAKMVSQFGFVFHALKLIDVSEMAETMTCDLTLDPGRAIRGTILGPDGQPVSGVRVFGLTDFDSDSTAPLPSADFTVPGLTADTPRLLSFYHKERQLAVQVLVRAEDKAPLTVRLEKCATLIGRLVDEDKNPRPGVQIRVHYQVQPDHIVGREITAMSDKEGLFRIEGLVAGAKCSVATFEGPANAKGRMLWRDVTVAAGATKDLGDVAGTGR